MKVLDKVFAGARRALDVLIGVIMLAMIVVVAAQIISRFLFNKPLIWSEELSRYLMIWMAFLAIPVCVKKDLHLKVDLGLDKRLSPAGLLVKDCVLNALAALVWVLIVRYGYPYAMTLTRVNAFTFRLAKVYLFICIPVSAALTVLFLLEKILGSFRRYAAAKDAKA